MENFQTAEPGFKVVDVSGRIFKLFISLFVLEFKLYRAVSFCRGATLPGR